MAADTNFFKNFRNQILFSINTAFPAKVLAFDESSLEAKIQPLFKVKEVGEEPETVPVIEGVPALKHEFSVEGGPVQSYDPVLKVGNIVLCVCAQRSLDDAFEGKPYYAGKSRILDIQDAVIVGVLR